MMMMMMMMIQCNLELRGKWLFIKADLFKWSTPLFFKKHYYRVICDEVYLVMFSFEGLSYISYLMFPLCFFNVSPI
jgi:hypothetical protein